MIENQKDVEKIRQLVREGKMISTVMEEDFPGEYEYWEIYEAAWVNDERSALGVKRMISNRLKVLNTLNKAGRDQAIDEIDELVWRLYERLKSSQKKLGLIRDALDEK